MPTLVVTHVVRDFDAWKEMFESDPLGREPAASADTASCERPTIPTT
jgi:hypothetical protein